MKGLALAALTALLACGKTETPPKKETPAPALKSEAPPEGPLFRFDVNEPSIPDAPDHSQPRPGPDGPDANRAGFTTGKTSRSLRIGWADAAARAGSGPVYAREVEVEYHMTIAISVASDFPEGGCAYRVTWEHELSHARAFQTMFAASAVHLRGALGHAQQVEPLVPDKDAPVTLKSVEVDAFEAAAGEKLKAVVEDQARVLNTLMEDHRRDRDSPEAYRIDTAKCPMEEWRRR